MVYPNLNAEMARHAIKVKDVADLLGMELNSAYQLLNGKRKMTVGRAYAIKKAFFPDLSIDYLFQEGPER